ncbi:RsmE family RNA methyltransferase [Stratiformator vulcanicus]|uniref:Ribosomal RNA small subunit methyltransferase E n=1 Tax=Stratiformator vulcanicus TaxID=2527980 RepID=A0A517R4G4_9PLAN|nr:RsmE family RNA methyltransferase [Stratiformator vulcanicus]QDT38767.1 Ribosomal RNA small subunit methyltransferase E [Stratiformator vulcanicus]
MSERFFVEQLEVGEIRLDKGESQHFATVMRGTVGSTVQLFDGTGREAFGNVTDVSKKSVRILVESVQLTEQPEPRLTLAVAPPKGDRFRWLIEKATELGVARVIPLITERSVVDPRDSKLERLRQNVIAACKQSGRSRLMVIDRPIALPKLLKQASEEQIVLLDPHGSTDPVGIKETSTTTAFIGPEGGFSDEELKLFEELEATKIRLGSHILRTETAAIAAAARLAFRE